jgi:cell division septum initiation protein DivIVA
MAAQSVTPNGSNTSQVENDVKKLLDAVTAQQKALADQQKQISDQQQEIERLKQQLSTQAVSANGTETSPRVVNATLTTPGVTGANAPASDMAQDQAKEGPLSFKIGAAEFTPGGFVDFENVFRSTNTGNIASTNFGNIPFSNGTTGHLTEFRITGQYSRLSLKTHAIFGANDVTGYIEGDFNGNDAQNVFVGTNPHTARLRLYWLDLKRGKWEFLGGSAWGLMTPNRTGLSPNPSDLALTLSEDANIHVGINHTRAGTFRAIFHPNSNFAWGFGVENPQQYANGEVVFPTLYSAALTPLFDINSAANGNPGSPNVIPDFNTKLAWDSNPAGRKFHFELGATTDSVKITVLAPSNTTGAAFTSHSKIGGAVQTAFNFELLKNFRLLANGLWGNGPGRYLIGLAPQAVIVPVNGSGTTCTTTATQAIGCDAAISMVHAGNATVGFEVQPAPKTVFGVYYGGMYAQRNTFTDITSLAATKPNIGFGGIGEPGSAGMNRAVQEGTIDWNQTFWRNPQYGAVLLITQASYLTRAPWFVAAGAPKNAHLVMGYVSLRYVLP